MIVQKLFKLTFVLALLCIGIVVTQEGRIVPEVTQLEGGFTKTQNVQPVALINYESTDAPVKEALRVAIVFGYLGGGLGTVLIWRKLKIQVVSVLPSLRVRPFLSAFVALLFLVAPYFPMNPSEALSVRLILETIETNRVFLFFWAISMMIATAVATLYLFNNLLNLSKKANDEHK